MLCKKCGNELKMGSKFCYNCGYYIDEEDELNEDGSKKKKRKKDKNGEPKLSFKEKLEKRKEEKLLAKEAKIRQKEIEAEEKEREKMAAEYEKEQKIKDFYHKENQNKLRAEKKAKELEEKLRKEQEKKQKEIDAKFEAEKVKFDEELHSKINFSNNSNVSGFEEKKHDTHSHKKHQDYYNENDNFSYGTEDMITRSPGLGIEESGASHHVKDESELSFDDFKVENRYKKIENEIKSSSTSKNSSIDLAYEEPVKKKSNSKSEASKYLVVILASVASFVIIFFLVYSITNKLNSNKPEPGPVIVEDTTVLLGNCTLMIPGNLNYNVEGNTLYVAYDTHTLSFTISKDNYESYASDLTKLSKDFERRKYTVSSSDKREVSGQEFLVYKLLVNGSSKYFYLTKVNNSNVSMGMIELQGASNVDSALQSIAKIISTVDM